MLAIHLRLGMRERGGRENFRGRKEGAGEMRERGRRGRRRKLSSLRSMNTKLTRLKFN